MKCPSYASRKKLRDPVFGSRLVLRDAVFGPIRCIGTVLASRSGLRDPAQRDARRGEEVV